MEIQTLDYKILGFENDDSVNTNGFHYISTITATYDQLVEIFGKPTYTEADPYEKVNAEWVIDCKVYMTDPGLGDGPDDYFYKGFTIYNWKTGYIPTKPYEWHIGGKDYDAHELASAIFENHINSKSEG